VLLVLWLSLVAVAGFLGLGLLFVLYKKKNKGSKRTGSSWRQADYYGRFLAQLSQAQRTRFSTMSEADQFKTYMDWSLREGLGQVDHKEIYEGA